MNYIKNNVIDSLKQEIESWKDQLKIVVHDHSKIAKEKDEIIKELKEEIRELKRDIKHDAIINEDYEEMLLNRIEELKQ